MRLIFWVSAVISWPIALLLFATMNAVHFGGAEENAAKNRELIAEFRPKVDLVEKFLAYENRLPTYAELNGCGPKPYDMCGSYSVSDIRPDDPDFKFPDWPAGSKNYVISYWRGEWNEYYDSASKSYSMERADQASEWRTGWEYEALVACGFLVFPWLLFGFARAVRLRWGRRHA